MKNPERMTVKTLLSIMTTIEDKIGERQSNNIVHLELFADGSGELVCNGDGDTKPDRTLLSFSGTDEVIAWLAASPLERAMLSFESACR